ncbi:hypothetical protein BAE44_0010845, partial [Dichanthelium oligosanthes]
LLSAFAEMGLKLRVDMPQIAMENAAIYFSQSTTASEAKVDPIPRDAVIFTRVLDLLRASLNARIAYLDIMRPFVESTLLGKLKYDETVANIWPNFGTNRKELIKVPKLPCVCCFMREMVLLRLFANRLSHLLLPNKETLRQIAKCTPETEPGSAQIYHYLSFGWLCGGVIEHATGKKFQEVLEEAIVRPLHIDGELYTGIPPGMLQVLINPGLDCLQLLCLYHLNLALSPQLFFSTPTNSRSSQVSRKKSTGKRKGTCSCTGNARDVGNTTDQNGRGLIRASGAADEAAEGGGGCGGGGRIFSGDKILDAFMGAGEFESTVVHPNSMFGLGFRRYSDSSGKPLRCFGPSGMGRSAAFCDAENGFAIAVTVNKMSLETSVTHGIVRFVCGELGLPVPDEFTASGEMGPGMVLDLAPPPQQ